MRRHDAAAAAAQQFGQDRLCQRLPLVGVRSAAELVDEREALRVGAGKNADNIADMGGERRQILLDRLRVADIAEDRRKDGNFRPLGSRQKQAAARHHAEQPAHFQRDRLAARIRAGDQ